MIESSGHVVSRLFSFPVSAALGHISCRSYIYAIFIAIGICMKFNSCCITHHILHILYHYISYSTLVN